MPAIIDRAELVHSLNSLALHSSTACRRRERNDFFLAAAPTTASAAAPDQYRSVFYLRFWVQGTQILFAFYKMRRLGTIAATAVRLVAFWVVAFTVCCSNNIVRCVDTMSPPADCSIQFNQLAPCVPFVIGDAAAPSDACCKAIGDVASKSPVCLCMLVNSPLSPSTSPGGGGGFNVTLAFMLPSLCQVPADSSQCRGK